jgi:hypothetical protein
MLAVFADLARSAVLRPWGSAHWNPLRSEMIFPHARDWGRARQGMALRPARLLAGGVLTRDANNLRVAAAAGPALVQTRHAVP